MPGELLRTAKDEIAQSQQFHSFNFNQRPNPMNAESQPIAIGGRSNSIGVSTANTRAY